jgi:hypothetical protein
VYTCGSRIDLALITHLCIQRNAGIDRFLICSTCIGLDVDSGELYAPHGLDELEHGILRMNPNFPQPDQFRKKALSYQARWDWLRVAERD